MSLESVDERAQNDELPMQSHGHTPDAADRLPVDTHLPGQDPFLDTVEMTGETLSIEVNRLNHLLHDHFEKRPMPD
jgi:hypothetical protein